MAKIKNPWRDGWDCDVCEDACGARLCLQVAEDKGNYVLGRGYHKLPQPFAQLLDKRFPVRYVVR
jgi:hypothetical protein